MFDGAAPIYPHCLVKSNARVVSHNICTSGVATDQEFLDVSVYLSLLRRRQDAMRMTRRRPISHRTRYAQRLPNLTSGVCRTPGTLWTKPQNVILNDEYCPRSNQSDDRMMIKRDFIRRRAELIEVSPEPYILINDLRQRLS